MKTIKTREEWLLTATAKLRPLFKAKGFTLPEKIQVGCGWSRGGKREVIGQCFGTTWTSDGTIHIFVSPCRGDDIEVLAVLVHELVHAAVGVEEGHKGKFKKLARDIGLEGKLTATVVTEKSSLHPTLVELAAKLGKYPHSRMIPKKSTKPGGGGWVRLESRTIEGYTCVISPKSLDEYGYPMDPNGEEMVEQEAAIKLRVA